MKNKEPISDDFLLDYIDGNLPDSQKLIVEVAIGKNDEARERLKYLQQMDNYLGEIALSVPPENFTTRVMTDLSTSIYEINRKSKFNGFLILLLGIITLLAGAYFMSDSINSISYENQINTNTITNLIELPEKQIPLSINMGMLTHTLLFLILIFSLLLTDKLILKPYFKRRRTQYS